MTALCGGSTSLSGARRRQWPATVGRGGLHYAVAATANQGEEFIPGFLLVPEDSQHG
jgi:hypothetical protein